MQNLEEISIHPSLTLKSLNQLCSNIKTNLKKIDFDLIYSKYGDYWSKFIENISK